MWHDHFGVRWDGPVGWLVQSGEPVNALGISGQSCPFPIPPGRCNHQMAVPRAALPKAQWDRFRPFLKDLLVQVMLPLPRDAGDRGFLISDPQDLLLPVLGVLSRLCPPLQPVVSPLWMLSDTEVRREFSRTNLQPLVLTQVKEADQKRIDKLVQGVSYTPRTVLLSGSSSLVLSTGFKRIETTVDFAKMKALPLEQLGLEVLRRHLRKEEIV